MKLGQGYRRTWRLKIFFTFSSGGHFVCWNETILAILVGSYLGDISVKFKSHWLKG